MKLKLKIDSAGTVSLRASGSFVMGAIPGVDVSFGIKTVTVGGISGRSIDLTIPEYELQISAETTEVKLSDLVYNGAALGDYVITLGATSYAAGLDKVTELTGIGLSMEWAGETLGVASVLGVTKTLTSNILPEISLPGHNLVLKDAFPTYGNLNVSCLCRVT